MASVRGRLSLSMIDARGGRSTMLAHINASDALTIANANTAIATFATLAGTVSTAGIEQGTFTLVNTDVASAPTSDADVASGAVFDFSNAANPSVYGQFVPSFLDSLILPGGFIDISAGANAAFVAAMTGGVLGGCYANTAYVCNAAGLDAFLSSRKRRKRIR